MGRKGFNWKARQPAQTIIDDSETNKINLDLEVQGNYDVSNPLVLPSQKRKTKIKKDKVKIVQVLSKKHRKRLEKIVEKKNKKDNRKDILGELEKIQLSREERNQFSSIAAVQTKGLKRIFKESKISNSTSIVDQEQDDTNCSKFSEEEVELVNQLNETICVDNKDNLNTVGFEESSESELSDENETEVPSKKLKIECGDIDKSLNISENSSDICMIQTSKADCIETNLNISVVKSSDSSKHDVPKVAQGIVNSQRKPAVYVDVTRSPEIQECRLKLPILAEEQQIMETINANSIIIISGETGSGKTTQIPQFLYEAGYSIQKQIAVTEPRRIAAISMSKRVAEEMNLTSKEVSFLVRFQGNVTDDTKIKFMTDGVLLKEVQSDFLLSKYSVVVLDEAHERSLYTDILVGLLSRIVKLREKKKDPLKLIVMSATLRLEDFTTNRRLFSAPPPVINVETRQFPVTIHFNKRTDDDYMKVAFQKTVKLHTQLPEGGVLIFVTGQQEVNYLVNKLRKKFPCDRNVLKNLRSVKEEKVDGLEDAKKKVKKVKKIILPEINLNDYSLPGDSEFISDQEGSELDEDDEGGVETVCRGKPLWVLPLYSLLPVGKQNEIFKQPPPGCRLCVVSTNVAETSLTIPGIKYVVDSGKTKTKVYDKVTGVSSYVVCWTSKASADQRAGRAGRTGPGHCYRLYSSAVFNDTFVDFAEPEIRKAPADDLYLRMRSMNIEKIVNFPFPTAPDLLQLKTAATRLRILGILDKKGKITELGRAVAKFPLLPRFGKMLALSHQQDILPYTVCLVAALSVPEVMLEVPIGGAPGTEANVSEKWAATRHRWAGTGNSYLLGDNMVLLKSVGAAEFAHSEGKLEQFCSENGLRHKAISEIRKLRMQLTSEIVANLPESNLTVDPKMPPPNDLQAKLLRQILLTGLGDQIAKKMTVDEVPSGENKSKFKYAYHANNMEDLVYLHRGSVLKRTLPEFVVYQELYETNKVYMRGVTAIAPEWLPTYVPSLCNLTAPLDDPEPSFTGGRVMCSVKGTFGSQAWSLPVIRMEYPESEDAYKWFGRFLLEGEVVDRLRRFTPSLLSQPSIMVKKWAKLQPRTQTLLNALMSRKVRRTEVLLEMWRENPKYLLLEYLDWLPQSAHSELSSLWPPV